MYGKAFPVAVRSKAWVCGHSLAEIVGSNPAGGMNVSLVSVVWFQVEVSASGRSPSRVVLPSVVCLSTIVNSR